MTKTLSIFLLILTCISCKKDNRLELIFESHLPETDQVILNKIINSYDNLITTEFKGNTNKFLSQIESNSLALDSLKKQEYCDLVTIFDNSTLEVKNQNVKYDSVYLSDSGSIIKIMQPEDISTNGLELDEEIIILPPGQTIEEEVEKIKNRGYWRFISVSSFESALSKIENENIDVKEYLDAKKTVGYLNPQRMASSILKSDIDVSNYFIKRIIAIELFIKQIKSEYGCTDTRRL